jgi:hypothetical protein
MKPAIRSLQAVTSRETGQATPPEFSTEKHYSVAELAKIWQLSEHTVRRMFENQPGVLRWGSEEQRFRRRYVTLRIPESVVARVHRQLQTAS